MREVTSNMVFHRQIWRHHTHTPSSRREYLCLNNIVHCYYTQTVWSGLMVVPTWFCCGFSAQPGPRPNDWRVGAKNFQRTTSSKAQLTHKPCCSSTTPLIPFGFPGSWAAQAPITSFRSDKIQQAGTMMDTVQPHNKGTVSASPSVWLGGEKQAPSEEKPQSNRCSGSVLFLCSLHFYRVGSSLQPNTLNPALSQNINNLPTQTHSQHLTSSNNGWTVAEKMGNMRQPDNRRV